MTPLASLRLNKVTLTSLRAHWRFPRHLQARAQLTVRSNYSDRDRHARYAGAAVPSPSKAAPTAKHPTPSPAGIKHPSSSTTVASRQRVLQGVPHDLYRVVGVSFEGRQALVAELQRGQAVEFAKEPSNEFDPNAVAVRTLDGQQLGYISREETQRFPQELCFGYVYSVGQSEDGLWGFRVAVQPTIPPVQVLAIPQVLVRYANLAPMLSGSEWEAVRQSTLDAANNRCEVTGGRPAECGERWQFDDSLHIMRLVGFRAVAPEVRQVEYALTEPLAREQQAIQLLEVLNEWQEGEAGAHLQHARQLQAHRSQHARRLDLGLLKQLGIQIPGSIAPMHVLQ